MRAREFITELMSVDQARIILDLPPNFTKTDIDQKYRTLIRQWHPDRFANRSPEEQSESNRMTVQINIARKVLLSGGNPESAENSKKGQAIQILRQLSGGRMGMPSWDSSGDRTVKGKILVHDGKFVVIDLTIDYDINKNDGVHLVHSPSDNLKFRTSVDSVVSLISDGNFKLPVQDNSHSLPLLEYCVISIPDSAIYYIRSNNISFGWLYSHGGDQDQQEAGFSHLEYGKRPASFEKFINLRVIKYLSHAAYTMIRGHEINQTHSGKGDQASVNPATSSRRILGQSGMILDEFYKRLSENIQKDILSITKVSKSKMESLPFDRKPIIFYDFSRIRQLALSTEKQYQLSNTKRLSESNSLATPSSTEVKTEKKSSLSYIIGALSEYSAAYDLIDTLKYSPSGKMTKVYLSMTDDSINFISNKLEEIKTKAKNSDISDENIDLGIKLGQNIAKHIYTSLSSLPDISFCKVMVTGTDTRHGASDDLKIEIYKDPSMVAESLINSLRYSLKVTKDAHVTISGSKSPIEFLKRLVSPQTSVNEDYYNDEDVKLVKNEYGDLGKKLIYSLQNLKTTTDSKNQAKKDGNERDKENENRVSIASTDAFSDCLSWWVKNYYSQYRSVFNNSFRWLLGMDDGVEFIKAVYKYQTVNKVKSSTPTIVVSDKNTSPVYKALLNSLMSDNVIVDIKFNRKQTTTEKIVVTIKMKVPPDDMPHLSSKMANISDDGSVVLISTGIELRVADSGYIKPYINTNTRNMKI